MRPELAAEAFLQIALGRTRARDPVERRPHVKLVAEQGGVVGADAHVDHVLSHVFAGCEHLVGEREHCEVGLTVATTVLF